MFNRVFPRLVGSIADAAEDASLSDVRSAALIFLYRLLFVLYAEDRGLLPVNDSRYDDYGLRKRVREEVARRMAEEDTFSATACHYYNRLSELFRQIDQGDESHRSATLQRWPVRSPIPPRSWSEFACRTM